MPLWIWIVIIVVALLIVAAIVGVLVARARRVSITEAKPADEQRGVEKPPGGGGYRAGGSISFSSGSGTAVAEPPPAKTTQPQPAAPRPAGAHPDRTAPQETAEPAAEAEPTGPVDSAPAEAAPAAAPTAPQEAAEPAAEAEPTGPVDTAPAEEAPAATPATTPTAPTEPAPAATPETAAPAAAEPTPTEVVPQDAAPITEEIAPTTGRLSRLRGRLSRSQSMFGRSLLGLLGAGDLDEASWEEVEDTLLMADLGATAALEITDALREQVASRGVADAAGARAMLRSVLIDAVGPGADRSVRALPHDGRPAVVLMVGVNGTGKTTTTGKLARVLVADGHSVVLGAADTFRAAAAEQLATWADRSGSTLVRGPEKADPASVAFDAVKTGVSTGADVVLIDTAGRLHTKTGLMDELGKVKRVVEKQAEVDEVLLVLDATTGQNGLVQAKVFAEVVNVSGIVLTKLDGTAKGGIVVAVQRELGVPVKLVGLGEGPDDLAPFEPEAFVDALLGD